MQTNTVQTFDNLTYSLPQIDAKCFAVISADCSSEHNFLVVASKDNELITHKVFLNHKFKIEFIPSNESISVTVNGNQISVSKTEPYIQTITFNSKEVETFLITFNGAYYTLDARKLFGVVLNTDGQGYSLEVDRYYTGKVCGICGDNNGDSNYEFKGANGQTYKHSNPFVYSYVIPDNECVPQPDWTKDSIDL